MDENEIKVRVVKYPDRKQLMLRYVDPVTGRQQCRSARTTSRRDAERAAAKWEAELQAGRYRKPSKLSWAEFRTRYEDEKLSSLSPNTAEATASAFNHLEKFISPGRLASVTATVLSQFQAELRRTGIQETSIATHLRHLRAALGWAVSMGLLGERPAIQMPKRAKGQVLMRGRPISTEEFERMLMSTATVRPRDAHAWCFFLRGLWLSGLRLEESLTLSWDEEATITVDFSGRRPRLRILAEAEKGHQDRLLPITPDFAQFLTQVSVDRRSGPVFSLIGLQTGKPISAKRVSRIVSAIGRRAGVVVNKKAGKFASAHDLRRAFGTRWSSQVKPATLRLLMRHRSIETTLKYYVEQDADDVADELWQAYAKAAATSESGNSLEQPR